VSTRFAGRRVARHLRRSNALQADGDAAHGNGIAIDHAGAADQLLGGRRLDQQAEEGGQEDCPTSPKGTPMPGASAAAG
jgi:hypothetical protein